MHWCLIWWRIDTLHRLSTCSHQVPWRPMWNLDNCGLTVTLIHPGGGAVFPSVWAPAIRLFAIGIIDTSLQTLRPFQPVEWWLPWAHNLMLLYLLANIITTIRQRRLLIWWFWCYRYDNRGLCLIQNIHSNRLKPSDCLIGGPHVGTWGRLGRHMVLCFEICFFNFG